MNATMNPMIRQICEMGDFVRRMRVQMRFGTLSRAPLRLLRLELREEVVECDWLARDPDRWDADLPAAVGERNASLQALEDAVAVRSLLFSTMPALSSGMFRVYRQSRGETPTLIMTGVAHREERVPTGVRSLAMRAKLAGFRFWLADGVLKALQLEEQHMSL
jgi:hypothetical protein